MRICTLGDLLLDVIVRLDHPLVSGDDVVATTTTTPGGQAANVAAWSAELGAEAAFIGRRGADQSGRLVSDALAGYGVELFGPMDGRNGVVVSLVDPDGMRSMASDRGVAPELRADDVQAAWLEGCDWLHIAGYSLLREPIASASRAAVGHARAAGAHVSVDLSTSTAIRAYGPLRFRSLLDAIQPDLVFGTAAEMHALGGGFDAREWILKRGADGIVVGKGESKAELQAVPAEAVDSTGAGDALAAGYLVGGPELALETAARCVAKPGAMP